MNLKTGQSLDDNILPWSLYSTLLLYGTATQNHQLFGALTLDSLMVYNQPENRILSLLTLLKTNKLGSQPILNYFCRPIGR